MDKNQGKTTFTRQELYELVWTTPVRRLAAQFGISDVGLAKACKGHMIPTPPPGYWAKKAHGKIVRRASLPPCDDPAMATVTIGGCSVAGNSPAAAEKPPVVSTFFDPELGRLAEAEARGDDPIVVAESLRSPHPLVARTREGLTAAYKSKYRRELVVYPSPVSDLCCLDLRVGQDNFSRALRVIDALIKGLEIRGYEVSVPIQQWKPGTLVKALGVRFQIKLREPTMRQAHEPTAVERESIKKYPNTNSVPKWDHVPSNQLVLELQTGSGWTICTVRDGKKRRIEDNLLEIPLAILRHADDDKRKAVAAAEEARNARNLIASGGTRKSGDDWRNSVGKRSRRAWTSCLPRRPAGIGVGRRGSIWKPFGHLRASAAAKSNRTATSTVGCGGPRTPRTESIRSSPSRRKSMHCQPLAGRQNVKPGQSTSPANQPFSLLTSLALRQRRFFCRAWPLFASQNIDCVREDAVSYRRIGSTVLKAFIGHHPPNLFLKNTNLLCGDRSVLKITRCSRKRCALLLLSATGPCISFPGCRTCGCNLH